MVGPIDAQQIPVIRVGVIADTHIPKRIKAMPQEVLDGLRGLRVDHILHAGDICVPEVIEELAAIAPVTAARGNGDLSFGENLAMVQFLEFNGVRIALTHGSGSTWDYIRDQWAYALYGYKAERYIKLAAKFAGDAQVIVFGHSHRPLREVQDGRLFFNPGSACFGPPEGGRPSIGLLQIDADGKVLAEIIQLPVNLDEKNIRKQSIA